jgi:ABC-type sulfate transport system permease subunit
VQVLLLSLLDLPFSISPVVTGLMLMLLYGRAGWFAQALAENGLTIVFAFPGERCAVPCCAGLCQQHLLVCGIESEKT